MEVRDKYAPSAHMSGVPEGSKSDYPFGRFCFSVDRTKENRSAFGTVSHHLHRQRRSAVKTFVSKKTVQTFQASICLVVESLCREFKHFATTGDIFECSIFFLCWATDNVSRYLENETYGLLEDEQRRKNWQRTINKVVELTPIVKQYPFFMPFLFKVPPWIIRLISSDLDLVLLMHKVREKTFFPSHNVQTAVTPITTPACLSSNNCRVTHNDLPSNFWL